MIFDGEMVKITTELVAKCPSQTKKKKNETSQQYLKRLTHVYLAEKCIDEIVSIRFILEYSTVARTTRALLYDYCSVVKC